MTTIVVGNIPPPVDGAGVVTAHAVELMQGDIGLDIEVFDCFDEKHRTLWELTRYARAALRLTKPDVTSVYIQGVQGERMFLVLLLLLVSKVFGKRVLHHHHAFKFIDHPSLLWRVICSPTFDVVHVVLSELMGTRFESIYGNQNWSVVSNAAFVNEKFLEVPQVSKVNDEELVILFAGVAGIGKGEDVLVDAVRLLSARSGRPVKLVLAGRGHETSEDFVEVTGVLSTIELARRMWEADVLVLPSSYAPEAAPMVLYEAAACGLASVSSERGCIAEMSDELNGNIVLAEPKVSELVASIDYCSSLSSRGTRSAFLDARKLALDEFGKALRSQF